MTLADAMANDLPDWVRNAARYCADPLRAARDLRPLIQASAAEGARQAYVPDTVIRALAETGMCGLKVPRAFGGSEVDARTYIDVIEELSYADGSTGWVVMASGFAGGGVGLGPSATEEIFNGGGGIMTAAQISSLGTAERVDGGYRVQGNFHFGSGSRYASSFGGAFAVLQDGKPVLTEAGKPKTIFAFTPRRNVRLKGNWDVFGLAATGSYDFDFIDHVIPDDWVTGLPGRETHTGPIHAITVSIGHVAWALGVGRRALEEIHALAQRKKRFGRTTLIDQPVFQLEYGRHLMAMRAARALTYEVFDTWYEAAKAGPPGIEVRADARLASCWATEVALKAAQFAFFSAGSDGIRNHDGDNILQRVMRDMQAGAVHRHIDGNIMIEAAQVALGVAEPELDL
jgi:alkylation response protein AidB-like acyl-CoA dehydrogenase